MSGECLPLRAIHHVELLVGNAKQAAYFYRHAFGFSQLAYAGPETGVKEQASYVLYQGSIRLVVSTPLSPQDPMAEHLHRHGDGVLDIAFLVDDVDRIQVHSNASRVKASRDGRGINQSEGNHQDLHRPVKLNGPAEGLLVDDEDQNQGKEHAQHQARQIRQ